MNTNDERLVKFYHELLGEIGVETAKERLVASRRYAEFMSDYLIKTGCFEELELCPAKGIVGQSSYQVDGWYYNRETGDLSLVLFDFTPQEALQEIGTDELKMLHKKLVRFFQSARGGVLQSLGTHNPDAGHLVDFISNNEKAITRVLFYVVTNKLIGRRVTREKMEALDARASIENRFQIWDIARYFAAENSDRALEPIEASCTITNSSGLPFLKAETAGDCTNNEYSAYLMVVPGACLYTWYDIYGDRLLEQNVRTFLQCRNKGPNHDIRMTLAKRPNRFFAYNNGITATADSIEFDNSKKFIQKIIGLQIVNGGQTTASIFTAYKKCSIDLTKVSVQMKLIVVKSSAAERMTQRISQYANNQNAVKSTDLASNEDFLRVIQNFSQRLVANPTSSTSLKGVKWYFERMRGQYKNLIAKEPTDARRKELQKELPKDRVFTKGEMAKHILIWDLQPWVGCTGTEKSFVAWQKARFATLSSTVPMAEHYDKWANRSADGNPQFCEHYYKQLIGKIMLFKALDARLRKQNMGYKSHREAYTIALFHQLLIDNHKYIDLCKIWNEQQVPSIVVETLVNIADLLPDVVQRIAGAADVQETYKKKETWDKVVRAFEHYKLPEGISQSLISEKDLWAQRQQSVEKQAEANSKISLEYVRATPKNVWGALWTWIRANPEKMRNSSAKQCASLIEGYIRNPFVLDVDTSKKLIQIWNAACDESFPILPLNAEDDVDD